MPGLDHVKRHSAGRSCWVLLVFPTARHRRLRLFFTSTSNQDKHKPHSSLSSSTAGDFDPLPLNGMGQGTVFQHSHH